MTKSPSNISELWNRLEAMEREHRFDGKKYPTGMCPFPFRLVGQGFFPGGDGLWRPDDKLSAKNNGGLPIGGVLFLRNDFGTVATYRKLENSGYENPPTWRHIKERIRAAQISVEATFFTNAIVGLREEGTALTKKSWQTMPKVAEFCGEFLRFQLDTLRPRLTVIMGPDARVAFDKFVKAAYKGQTLVTGHPYADFGLTAERRAADIRQLSSAWASA
jgi:hypothetical protein